MSSPLLVDILAYWNLNDNGSGGVSLLDATGNGYTLTNPYPVNLGTGIIGGDAVFTGTSGQYLGPVDLGTQNSYSIGVWLKWSGVYSGHQIFYSAVTNLGIQAFFDENTGNIQVANYGSSPASFDTGIPIPTDGNWHYYVFTQDGSGNFTFYLDATSVYTNTFTTGSVLGGYLTGLGAQSNDLTQTFNGQIDEVGIWNRALSPADVTYLYNNGNGITYPFIKPLYYNDAQDDGDWGNILNWWQDAGFTSQATALPDSTTPVNLYNQVTQNTQGANQCFCSSASFWSADFGVGLTLQSTGVVNMQGTSVMAGATTDGVSMHDSSTLTDTSSVAGDVTMRDSSRAYGYVGGNAYVYYDQGNGQFPIGGTVVGTVSYIGWPAISPQWFNDTISIGGAGDGDWNNQLNWWTDNTYTTRPINAEGYQQLPDASTDVFIAPTIGITTNSGTANPTINSVTANNSNIQNISITATNGFLFSGNQGVENAVLYGNVVFQDTAYNDHAVIQGKATYKSAASLQNSWGQNSLGNVNAGMYNGSTSFEVNIPTGNSNKGFLSTLLGFPWYIRF